MELKGFGIDLKETNTCYIVEKTEKETRIWIRYKGTEEKILDTDQLHLCIPREKWDIVEKSITGVFNSQLKKDGKKPGKFYKDITFVERMLGKEMMVLLWAIENSYEYGKEIRYERAISNWVGFRPEERWWLHTMINAATGHDYDANRGWRVAIKYILNENPI